MAVVLTLTSQPSAWNSVHQPIPFVLDFEEKNLTQVNDVSGSAQFVVTLYDYELPTAGDRIYVESGIYAGFHTVVSTTLSVGVINIQTNTTYTANSSGMNVKAVIPVPEISLYKGYDTGEEYDTELPYELVATFTPVVSLTGDIQFDVSGFLKSIFTIEAPTIGIDFSLFNRFRIDFTGNMLSPGGAFYIFPTWQALNSAIPTAELMSTYFGTGVYLSSSTTQIIFGCGKTILSLLDATGVVINTEVEDGDTGADYFYDDYNEEDYLTQIST